MIAAVSKIKGISIDIGGEQRIVPPLSLHSLEQLLPRLNAFKGDASNVEDISIVVDSTHEALLRNYPEITRDEIARGIGLENFLEIMEAVMDVSGLKRQKLEANEKGEV
jgi:hypothetical protein